MRSTAELVAAAQKGDLPAFAELVERYERVATASAWGILGDFHAAQDAAQEGLLIAYRKLRTLRGREAFGPWLLQIVGREARRRASQLRKTVPIEALAHEIADSGEAVREVWNEQHASLVQAIARLPEQERVVVVFRYLDVLSVNEIAERTGRPVGTVTKQLSRAIQRLRDWLRETLS